MILEITEKMFSLWDERERTIVDGRFIKGRSLASFAPEFDVSISRIQQLQAGALERASKELRLGSVEEVVSAKQTLAQSKVLNVEHPLHWRLALYSIGVKTVCDGEFVHAQNIGDFLELMRTLRRTFDKQRDGHRVPLELATQFFEKRDMVFHSRKEFELVLSKYQDLEFVDGEISLNYGSFRNELEHLTFLHGEEMMLGELREAYSNRKHPRAERTWDDHSAREAKRKSEKIWTVDFGRFVHEQHLPIEKQVLNELARNYLTRLRPTVTEAIDVLECSHVSPWLIREAMYRAGLVELGRHGKLKRVV